MRSVTGISDPREGEWPEEAEWCHEKGQLKESCYHCHAADIDRANFERELTATEAQDALCLFMRDVLDKINAR